MNRITLAAWFLSLALAQGQGLVVFNNSPTSVGNGGAPVYDIDGVTRLSGTNWLAQLFAGPDIHTLAAIGEPLTFRTGAAAGFVDISRGTVRSIPTVGQEEIAAIRIVVWPAHHPSWVEAARAHDLFTWSEDLYVVTGCICTSEGGSLPANLIGLRPFSLRLPRIAPLSWTRTQSAMILQWDCWDFESQPVLEWTSDLNAGAQWQVATNAVLPVAGTWSVRLDLTAGTRFFRLHHPTNGPVLPPTQAPPAEGR